MHDIPLDLIPTFILGATALAFIYHAIIYIFNKDRFLLHYIAYLFFTAIFLYLMSGLIAVAYDRDTEYTVRAYLKEPVQILYLTSYFNFIVEAIEVSKNRKIFVFRYWKMIRALLVLYAVFFPTGMLFLDGFNYKIPFITARIFIFAITAMMLYQSFKLRKIKFQRIILIGCAMYFVFGIISFSTNMLPNVSQLPVFPLEWLMIGTFVDIIFFSIAIAYRNRRKWKNLNKARLLEANRLIALQSVVLEKQKELENERSRIAADMHDDLGSGLTKITYLSQMALNNVETETNIVKIKEAATELVGNMSELIWVMKEENNTVEDLATYIKTYAVDYLENNGISFKMKMPDAFPDLTISGNERRNLFLSVKECLHNIVKHAGARNVSITIAVDNDLCITICDDGIGFSEVRTASHGHGNGLKNMRSRMEQMNGSVQFTHDIGTTVCLSMPFHPIS